MKLISIAISFIDLLLLYFMVITRATHSFKILFLIALHSNIIVPYYILYIEWRLNCYSITNINYLYLKKLNKVSNSTYNKLITN